ncbi:MAG: methyltransferase domain-containing protein [Desulfobacterales bacterium]|nr:methyltransferase domain-containing protein [Desulfobacterales bacterium]
MSAWKFPHAEHAKLCSPERKRNMPVEPVLAELQPLQGMTVLDIGAGTGYFALPLARAALPGGRVYAVDTSQKMLDLMEQGTGRPENIHAVLSREASIPLEDALADLIFLSAVSHEFEDRPVMLKEMQRLGKPGARHVVIDWNQRTPDIGPPPEQRVDPQVVIAEYESAGLRLVRRFDPSRDFYGLIFSR